MTGDPEKSSGEIRGRVQPHWTLDCRDHPPGGGARREGGSSCTGGQPTGYWKTVVLMGSVLERRRAEGQSGAPPGSTLLSHHTGCGNGGHLHDPSGSRALITCRPSELPPLLGTESMWGSKQRLSDRNGPGQYGSTLSVHLWGAVKHICTPTAEMLCSLCKSRPICTDEERCTM